GRVTDTGSGVTTLLVQGLATPFDASGSFSTSVALDEGVAPIVITAIDAAGNRTDRTLSVETGNYRPASQLVPGALAGRINAPGLAVMEKIAQGQLGALQPTIASLLAGANPVF